MTLPLGFTFDQLGGHWSACPQHGLLLTSLLRQLERLQGTVASSAAQLKLLTADLAARDSEVSALREEVQNTRRRLHALQVRWGSGGGCQGGAPRQHACKPLPQPACEHGGQSSPAGRQRAADPHGLVSLVVPLQESQAKAATKDLVALAAADPGLPPDIAQARVPWPGGAATSIDKRHL